MANVNTTQLYQKSTHTETVALVDGRQINSFNTPSVAAAALYVADGGYVRPPPLHPTVKKAMEDAAYAELASMGGIASRDLLNRWPGWLGCPIAQDAVPGEGAMAALRAARGDYVEPPPLHPLVMAAMEEVALAELASMGGVASQDLANRWPGWMTPPITQQKKPMRMESCLLPLPVFESPKEAAERRLKEVSEKGSPEWYRIISLTPEVYIPELHGPSNDAAAALNVAIAAAAGVVLPPRRSQPPSRFDTAVELLTELVRLDGKANRALLNKWPHWLGPRPSDRYALEEEALQKLEALGGVANLELANQWPGWMAPPILDSSITLSDFFAAHAAENPGVT
jgi:hypothetical protein